MVSSGKECPNKRLETIRHSTSHVMAQAVLMLFPEVKFGIGPSIEDGFYYDFELSRPLIPEDLSRIEQAMTQIIKDNLPFSGSELSKEEARQIFSEQPYKLELIEDMSDDEQLSIYLQGSFVDLCRGPHVQSTGKIKAFKLLNTAGAYWRGDERRPMLQRIYGTAFETQQALKDHLQKLEDAARRDHRRMGRELDLYSIHEEAGPGLILWHPKGALVRSIIEDFWRQEHFKRGYDIVYTPHIFKVDLWKTSGHWDHYQENLYSPMDVDGQDYIVKPMNCPGHILMYKTNMHSYRELPMRWAELGTVYRYERSGVLHGLARVRGFTQDDAHIFCTAEQLESEVLNVLELAEFMMRSFGFPDYELYLSTRPDKYAGRIESWEKATQILENAIRRAQLPYEVDPGAGVFYGPKIDIKLRDALGREWQGPTIQVDFNLPERFNVTYVGEDGQDHLVIMIHRTVLGSMERFMACLIENYAGAFPVWLAPVQALIIPIADRHLDYAHQVEECLKASGFRAKVDARSERMNLKIREAQVQKIPYMLIIGDKEMETSTLSIRLRSGEILSTQTLEQFQTIAESSVRDKV